MSAEVSLRHLVKQFGGVTAVNDVSIEVAAGESLVILGPSGSGKSTLLRIVAGLEALDSGDVLIGGKPQQNLPPHERDVAIVFQHFALYPHMSALENITLGLRHGLGLDRAAARQRGLEFAKRMDIEDLLDRKPRQMSGGQRQRVALARALARQARLVLLDEPLSGLDAQLHIALRQEIADLMRTTGATSIHVTHDQSDAMALADRIAVINKGCFEQIGTPDEIYNEPATVFVAGFIGSPPMNLLPGTAVDGGYRTIFGDVEERTTAREVRVGVRPEHVRIDSTGRYHATAIVHTTIFEGSTRILEVTVGDVRLAVRTDQSVRVRRGDSVSLSFGDEDAQLFDAETGRRIERSLSRVR
ncbi:MULTISPECIES: ABC transporter ATP-binding protein [Actinomycetes]|jgi:multiple sugar transport system ATP-binding protein|uniref:sn-glycerol-3-phosphate import ATP-binding protein UgpC n=1 Tax=Microbacterium ginsengisoli TaxID=400772 RepID=A0A0F0M3Y2_9MICO|nr:MULTISPECIES: ABC transporter ATP-binding protein [Actinomycetes]KJL45682.1 sn-glycerol-3-phosphate import ATP-binding protein UgpC [Microbacterium ginsengisoli]MCC4268543.1 ABC transporter ATP-binding protein [Microbacterium schleiferi]MUK03311.1 ATP-binding cassette domain-containing protein [Vibrio cholerae]